MLLEANKLHKGVVEALAKRGDEPGWMLKRRLEAWEAFERHELPRWWHTDLRGLSLEGVEPHVFEDPVTDLAALPAALTEILTPADEEAERHLLVQRNSSPVYRQAGEELARKGVIFTDLNTALKEHPDLVERYFGRAVPYDLDKFTALHTALWTGGVFVYVPKEVEVEVPLQVQYLIDRENAGVFPHTLIVADANSRVTFVEASLSTDVGAFHAAAVEILTEQGARVDFGSIQNLGTRVYNFTNRRALLGRDSQVYWNLGEFGSKLSRTGFQSDLIGPGSESRALSVFFGNGKQHLDIAASMHHVGDHTTSDMVTKGALNDKARCVYNGLSDIDRGARDTKAYQNENTLLLSDEAKSDAIPGLYIDETELQAGHAATVGQIDKEMVFYLQARGLSEAEATRLIVQGFFEPIVSAIPVEGVQEALRRMVDRKMGV